MRLGSPPFLTWYGDERVELSYATFDNWAAKTANLLTDAYQVGVGDRVGLDLPPHWHAVTIAFGIRLVQAEIGRDGVVRFVWRDRVVIEPDGVDYADEVLAYADTFPGRPEPRPGAVEPGERVLLRAPTLERLLDVASDCYAVGAGLVVGDADPAAERVTRILDA